MKKETFTVSIITSWYYSISLQTDCWQQVASLNVPRQQLGVGSIGKRIFAVGGSDGYARLNTVECFNLETNGWVYTKSLNTSRSGVGVGVLGEALYALGGYDGRMCLKTVERYDPQVDSWSCVSPTNITRSFPGKKWTSKSFDCVMFLTHALNQSINQSSSIIN